MSKPPYVRLFVKDFAFDVQGMSDKELGAYMRQFIQSYKSEEIPDNFLTESLFFSLKTSLESYDKICERNKQNRSKSKDCANESSDFGAPKNDNAGLTNNQEPITNNHKPYIPLYPPLFERFWEAFPRQRRGSKDSALKAYRKALTRSTEEEIHEGTIRYAASDEVARGFGKGAAAWLNDDRWTFDYRQPDRSQATAANGKPTYADSIKAAGQAALNQLRKEASLWEEEDFG